MIKTDKEKKLDSLFKTHFTKHIFLLLK